MTTTKKKKPTTAEPVAEVTSTAIVLQEISLSPRQTGIVNAETPKDLIKSKPGRGGKRVAYVEGGYVISKLNQAFSPLGWEFKITERGQTDRKNENKAEGEVWVYGELTIIDHKNNFRTTKGQYGQHPIHEKVPIGDAYKAAATDALKKCASLLGIALDVYWGTLDREEALAPKDNKLTPAEAFERAKLMLKSVRDVTVLMEYDEKLKISKFTEAQKKELHSLISAQVDALDNKSQA